MVVVCQFLSFELLWEHYPLLTANQTAVEQHWLAKAERDERERDRQRSRQHITDLGGSQSIRSASGSPSRRKHAYDYGTRWANVQTVCGGGPVWRWILPLTYLPVCTAALPAILHAAERIGLNAAVCVLCCVQSDTSDGGLTFRTAAETEADL